MNFQTLKQNYINSLLETKTVLIKSINEEPFTLRSGRKSYMFFDHSRLAASPRGYKVFIDTIQYLLTETYKKILLSSVMLIPKLVLRWSDQLHTI